jgi:membrane protease YdiL (CAAX protease family)
MRDAGRGCLPDPARKAHWIAMTSNPSGDGFTRGFDQVPPEAYEPDPALAGFPPPQPTAPQPTQLGPASYNPAAPPQPYGYPNAYPPPVPHVARHVRALPDGPRVYQQMLRGPLYRWWKPLLSFVVFALLAFIMMGLAIVPVLVAGLITGAPDLAEYAVSVTTNITNLGPIGFLYVNLALIVLIPASGLSIWIVHGVRPGFLSSVAGRIRWRWLLRCIAVLLPLWAVYIGLAAAATPSTQPRPDHWMALLVIVLLMTPLQAAGEEYFFRGWIMQNVGAWFSRPIIGLVLSLIVSAVVFSAAHLSPDPWVRGTIASIAVASGLAAWRTGGLEAGIAIHAVNNVLALGVLLIFGGWSQAFVGAQTTGTPMTLVLAVAVNGIALALILWQAKRAGLQPYCQPRVRQVGSTSPPAPTYPLGQHPAP